MQMHGLDIFHHTILKIKVTTMFFVPKYFYEFSLYNHIFSFALQYLVQEIWRVEIIAWLLRHPVYE